MAFDIAPARVAEADVAALLDRHFELMRAQSPAESCHVLPTDALDAPDIRLFALRENGQACGIGAIRLFGQWGELKSMHTLQEARGRGIGRALLEAMMEQARQMGLQRLNLETGSGPEHAAARRLYENAGFRLCPPFGDYVKDPLSVFMTRSL